MADSPELENELAPNSSEGQGVWVPEPDDDEKQEEAEETATLETALPIMEDLLEWFDRQIAITDSIKQAQLTAQRHEGWTVETALIAHQIVASLLEVKRDELLGRVETYEHNKNSDDE